LHWAAGGATVGIGGESAPPVYTLCHTLTLKFVQGGPKSTTLPNYQKIVLNRIKGFKACQ